MKKFIEYVLSFDPNFLDKIEGATPEEIEALERVVGFPLPQQYKIFLKLIGKNNANFPILYGEGNTNIDKIIELYEIIRDEGETIPENYVIVAVGNYINDLCMLNGDGENKVMILDGDKIIGFHANSLEEMLLKLAFSMYRLLPLPHSRSYSDANPERRLPLAQDIAKDLGFQILWFSDKIKICAQKDSAAVSIYQDERGGMTVYVGANSKKEAKRIGDVFEKKLKTKLVQTK